MDSDLIKLVSNVNSYEGKCGYGFENLSRVALENLQSVSFKNRPFSQVSAIEIYETGSFITGKDAGTLNTGIKIFGDLHMRRIKKHNG